MNSVYQYYNEIVLAFMDYEVDFRNGLIIIEVPESNKPFNLLCDKIRTQIERISRMLEPRDKEVIIRIIRNQELSEIKLGEEHIA